MRRSHRNNRVWWSTPLTSSSRSTKGSGMPFLPAILSTRILLSERSRKDGQHSCNIETLTIEKLAEQYIGVLCFRCYDVISIVKVCEPCQILNGWVMYTEEATNPDFSSAWTRAAVSCMFAPSKVTQEVSWLLLNWWIMLPFHSEVARLTLQTRKILLVGRSRDGPWRASALTCPNVKNWKKSKKNEKSRKSKKGKEKERCLQGFFLTSGDGSKIVFLQKMLQEIVQQLRPTKFRFWAPEKRKRKRKEKKTWTLKADSENTAIKRLSPTLQRDSPKNNFLNVEVWVQGMMFHRWPYFSSMGARPPEICGVLFSRFVEECPDLHAGGVHLWVGILISQALRIQGETEAKTQRQVLKCGADDNPFPSTERSGEWWISVQVPGNRGVKYRINLQR